MPGGNGPKRERNKPKNKEEKSKRRPKSLAGDMSSRTDGVLSILKKNRRKNRFKKIK